MVVGKNALGATWFISDGLSMSEIVVILHCSNIPVWKHFKELPIPPILQKVANTQIILAYFETPAINDLTKVTLFCLYSIISFL